MQRQKKDKKINAPEKFRTLHPAAKLCVLQDLLYGPPHSAIDTEVFVQGQLSDLIRNQKKQSTMPSILTEVEVLDTL